MDERPATRRVADPNQTFASGPMVTTSWDDGHPCDRRLADLLAECGIAGTFYVPISYSSRPIMESQEIRDLARGFEIGGHTMTHARLPRIDESRLLPEIAGCKEKLEQIVGREVTTFCYPYGRYNPRVRQAVIEAGFTGARTTRQFQLDIGNDPWSMPATITATAMPGWLRARHFLLTRNFTGIATFVRAGVMKSWQQLAATLFEMAMERGGVWHLWGHSWQIEQGNLWSDLRTLLKNVGGRQGISYLTNAEVLRARISRPPGNSDV